MSPRIHILLLALILSMPGIAQNTEISPGTIFDGEPCLAVHPDDPRHLVVSWMGFELGEDIVIKTRASFDGGRTWSPETSMGHVNPAFGSADPSLAFNSNGDLFLCYIDFSRDIDSGQVLVSRSIDGGLSFGPPVPVINMHDDPGKLAIDRPWMVIDRSGGPHDGTIYVTTMTAEGATPPYHGYFMRSTDTGATFSPWRYLDTVNARVGDIITKPMPAPATGPDGDFHALYPSYVPAQNVLPQYILASSSDGGASLDRLAAFTSMSGYSDPLPKKGHHLAVNPTDPNHLVFLNPGIAFDDPDVLIRESFDGGQTWTAPSRVNDDPVGNDRMQDLVWAAFDTDGDLVVTWRDRRRGTDSTYATATEIYAAFRHRDSTSFGPNVALSDTLVDHELILEEAGNDFMGVVLRDDTLSAVWGDVRTGFPQIFFQRMALPSQDVVGVRRLNIVPDWDLLPNPGDRFVQVMGRSITAITVTAPGGEVVLDRAMTPSQRVQLDIGSWATGTYAVQVTTAAGTSRRMLVKR